MKRKCQDCQQESIKKKRIYGKEGNESLQQIAITLPIAELMAEIPKEIDRLTGKAGLLLMKAYMDEEVKSLVGGRYERQSDRKYARWGSQGGAVVLGGQKFQIARPRVRDVAESMEAKLTTYDSFGNEGRFGEGIMRRLLLGVSSRDYKACIEDFGDGYGVSKANVSRVFVRTTEKQLKKLLDRSLAGIEFVAILIDGIEYMGETIVVALGITIDGRKLILGMRLGAAENTVVVTGLLESLVERGLDVTHPKLFVLDGAKALRKAVKNIWGDLAVIQRCQIHKRRNVKAHLNPRFGEEIDKRLCEAYAMQNFDEAKASLMTTVRYLERLSPDAARSVEEGLEETLTVHRLGLQDTLRKTLSSTNVIESCFDYTRKITHNVKRWQDGKMIVRWVGCALLESEKRFNRVRGHRQLSFLRSALQLFVKNKDVDSYAMAA